MNNQYSQFSYKNGNSFLHKYPPQIKILLLPVLSFCIFHLPVSFTLCFILLQIIIAFCLKFSLMEQIKDLKPVLYYAFLLFFVKLISLLFIEETWEFFTERKFASFFTIQNCLTQIKVFLSNETVHLLLKLLCLMQTTSIFFRTSTPVQIRDGLEAIENFIQKMLHLKKSRTVSNALSMFINFIPIVSKIWQSLKITWKARMGKKGLKMYFVLLPPFFSIGIKKAWNTARAVQIRQKD